MFKDAIPLSELRDILKLRCGLYEDFPYTYIVKARQTLYDLLRVSKDDTGVLGVGSEDLRNVFYLPFGSPPIIYHLSTDTLDWVLVIWYDHRYILLTNRHRYHIFDAPDTPCMDDFSRLRHIFDTPRMHTIKTPDNLSELPPSKLIDEGTMVTSDGTLLLTATDDERYAVEFYCPDHITRVLRLGHTIAMAKRQPRFTKKEQPRQNRPLVEPVPQQTKQSEISKAEKGITMSENHFIQTPLGFDLSFAQADPNLVMGTMIGIAIRSAIDAPWRIYDHDKHEVIDLGNLQMGNLPVWEGPAIKVKDGDIIKHDATYYYCESRKGQHLTAIDIATGKKQEIIMPKNILGMNIYRKLFSLVNLLEDDSAELSEDKLFMMMAMQNGEGMQNSLMPLMFLKDGDFGNDKFLMMMALSNMGGGQDANNGLVQLLLMKELLQAPHTPNTSNINIDAE